jgi:superfamily I DNA/RNA helicase
MLDTLGRALHRLVDEESVEPKDIVILTPRAEVRSALKDNVSVGRFALTRKNRRVPNQILVTTIHQFKGLERRVVILAELDETAHPDKNLILYVGCSRARVHLLLLHDHNFVI